MALVLVVVVVVMGAWLPAPSHLRANEDVSCKLLGWATGGALPRIGNGPAHS